MDNRPQWGTRAGFVLAAMGSAIGLGNIWRFPSVAYDNGGGAFFLPYLIALLTAGIPLLVLEFAMGHKYRGSAPLTMARINKKSEWLGWWQVAISFVIATYYSVIIAWAISYARFSINLSWGKDTESFLFGDYLHLADTPGTVGGIVSGVFIPLVIVWIIVLFILIRGIRKGIEIANKIFIPALFILFLFIVIRALTLDGAMTGLEAFFKPDWSQIGNHKVWVAAYGQIFFSLSIAFAIMVTYSSYLPRKTDITNNAFITGFANSSFELLAGIGVFAALGFMATQQNIPVGEAVAGGVGLAFVVFPQIINEMPALNGLFGFLFFACLVLAGLSSLISIVETFVSGVQDKFRISRSKSVLLGGGLAALISFIYATESGLYFLDAADYFINNFGVAFAGLVEVIMIAWIFRKLKSLQSHANGISDMRVGLWWRISLGVITPIVLGVMLAQNIYGNIKDNYEGYPTSFLLYSGWGVAVAAIVLGFIFMKFKWQTNLLSEDDHKGVS